MLYLCCRASGAEANLAANGSGHAELPLAPRQCPVCGERWTTLHCGNDGAVTVLRPEATPRAKLPLPLGTELDGRYVLTSVLGRGAFGAVYAAEQLATGQRVALKVLFANTDESQLARLRFTKESRVLGQLRHPSTVRVFDVGTIDGGKPYFVMELVAGVNLEQAMATLEAQGRRLSEAAVIDIAMPVLGSLAEAHSLGIVHRDLKPANIMVAEVADDHLVVKVVDFGVVRTHDSNLTARASVVGTPRYMSPEQCRGAEIDGRADLYSWACVMFEARAGRAPLFADSPVQTVMLQIGTEPPLLSDLGIETSPEFGAILARALQKDPAQRFGGAVEMRAALQALRIGRLRDAPATAMGDWLPELRAAAEPHRVGGPSAAAGPVRQTAVSSSYRVESGWQGDRAVSAYADTAIVHGLAEEAAAGPSEHARRMQAVLAQSLQRAPSRTLPPLPSLPAQGSSQRPRGSSPWGIDPSRPGMAHSDGQRGTPEAALHAPGVPPPMTPPPMTPALATLPSGEARVTGAVAAQVGNQTVIGVPVPPLVVAAHLKTPAPRAGLRVPGSTPAMAPNAKTPGSSATPMRAGRGDPSRNDPQDQTGLSSSESDELIPSAARRRPVAPPSAKAAASEPALSRGATPPATRHEESRPTPMPWQAEGTTGKPASPAGSQRAVRLPKPADLEAAIAARQKLLDDRARSRAETPTRFEIDEDRQKAAQIAPEPAAGRPRHALGRGTLIGTGLRRPAKTADDPKDEER